MDAIIETAQEFPDPDALKGKPKRERIDEQMLTIG